MLVSPHGQLERLEAELENKIAEITNIKHKLEAELRDRQQNSSIKRQMLTSAKQISSLVSSFKQALYLFTIDLRRQCKEWTPPNLQQELIEQISQLRQRDRQELKRLSAELCRLTTQNKSLAAEVVTLKEANSTNKHFEVLKKHPINIQEEATIDAFKLRKCDIFSPASKLVQIEKPSEDQSRSPALEFPCQQLSIINQVEQPTPSGILSYKTKLSKNKTAQISSASIVKTEPSQNCVVITSNRAESQRPSISKDLNKVCIEDLAKMIDKVTPSKIAIKAFADRIMKKSSLNQQPDDHQNAFQICGRIKPWARQSHHMHPKERCSTIIELGGKRRSNSKQAIAESKERVETVYRQAGGLKNRDTNIVRSQSKEKIKLTMKQNNRSQMTKSRTITRTADRKSSYSSSNYNHRSSINLPNLCEQLSKLELNVGDRRYELRYEGTKKEQQRCGNGKLEYINGLVYQGDFKQDVRHGYGVLSMHGKEIYKGYWQADQMQGKGCLKNIHYISRRKFPEDSAIRTLTYEGEFKHSTLHGAGSITLSTGHKFEGYFYNNTPQGDLIPAERLSSADTSQFLY